MELKAQVPCDHSQAQPTSRLALTASLARMFAFPPFPHGELSGNGLSSHSADENLLAVSLFSVRFLPREAMPSQMNSLPLY